MLAPKIVTVAVPAPRIRSGPRRLRGHSWHYAARHAPKWVLRELELHPQNVPAELQEDLYWEALANVVDRHRRREFSLWSDEADAEDERISATEVENDLITPAPKIHHIGPRATRKEPAADPAEGPRDPDISSEQPARPPASNSDTLLRRWAMSCLVIKPESIGGYAEPPALRVNDRVLATLLIFIAVANPNSKLRVLKKSDVTFSCTGPNGILQYVDQPCSLNGGDEYSCTPRRDHHLQLHFLVPARIAARLDSSSECRIEIAGAQWSGVLAFLDELSATLA